MDEELDASEGARIFKALQDLNLPPLAPLYNIGEDEASQPPWAFAPDRSDTLRYKPHTEIEALMISPHQEIVESVEKFEIVQAGLIEAVEEAWESLTATEQWIYHMLVDVGLSMRLVALAVGTPKTTFARRRDGIAQKIKNELLRHPVVIDYLER
jgi:hypothetical protein|tara:strand:- start:2782 stop:3246 length:465 start_codon:yes stop_codon:yes gene_type:complete